MLVAFTYVGTTTASFTNGRKYINLNESYLPTTALFIDDTGAFNATAVNANWTLASVTGVGPIQIYP